MAGVTPWWCEHCETFSTGLLGIDQEEMVPICIRDAGLSETGVVAAMASVLSASKISILGVSTLSGGGYATDFTLVPLSQLDEATRAFKAAGFRLDEGAGAEGGDAADAREA